MKQTNLLKLALISAILGTSFLYFLSETIPIEEKTISEIKEMDEGKVRLKGVVKGIRETDKSLVFTIERPEQIGAVLFGRHIKNLTIGDSIEIVGEISEYDGKKQILISEIK